MQGVTFQAVDNSYLGGVLTPPEITAAMQPRNLSNQLTYDAVLELVNKAPNPNELRESLATRLLADRGVSAYGSRIEDKVAAQRGEAATHLDVNRYGRTAAGATVAVTLTDPDTQEVYLLLGRKYKDAKHPEAGLGEFIAPGGYMNPKPPEGATPEALHSYDANLMQTAIRELQEETGLCLPEGYQPQSLGVDSAVENNKFVHTVNEFFHVNLIGKPQDMPLLQAQDDLASLEWVNVRNIGVNPSIGAQPDGSAESRYHIATTEGVVNLRDLHGSYLEQAVIAARQSVAQQVQQESPTVIAPQQADAVSSKWQDFIAAQRGQSRAQGQAELIAR